MPRFGFLQSEGQFWRSSCAVHSDEWSSRGDRRYGLNSWIEMMADILQMPTIFCPVSRMQIKVEEGRGLGRQVAGDASFSTCSSHSSDIRGLKMVATMQMFA